jgi:hypothetical protein
LPHVFGFLAAFSSITKQSTKLNMKNFVSLRIATLVLVTGYMLKATSADADVTFLGVAAGDATTNDVIVWTRAKDETNPQPTAINVQISQDPAFITGVTTLPAGTAGSPTDFTGTEQSQQPLTDRVLRQLENLSRAPFSNVTPFVLEGRWVLVFCFSDIEVGLTRKRSTTAGCHGKKH